MRFRDNHNLQSVVVCLSYIHCSYEEVPWKQSSHSQQEKDNSHRATVKVRDKTIMLYNAINKISQAQT